MKESPAYVGVVEPKNVWDPRSDLVYLRPIFELDDTGSTAEALGEGAVAQLFPNQGIVDWFRPPANAVAGSVWCFRITVQPTYDEGNPHHDKYRVDGSPQALCEVLDFGFRDETDARSFIVEGPLYIQHVPAESVFIRISDTQLVGPVILAQDKPIHKWVLDRSQPLPCVQGPKEKQTISVGSRRFLRPDAHLATCGYVDWASDKEILRRTLKSLRKRDNAFRNSLGLTHKAVDRLVSQLPFDDTGSMPTLDAYRVERARQIVDGIDQHARILDGIVDDLLAMPRIQREIERATIEAGAQAKRVAERELCETRDRIGQLEELEAKKRGEIDRLNELIEERRAQTKVLIDRLDDEMTTRLARVLERPQETLADIALFRAALSLAGAGSQSKSTASPKERANRVAASAARKIGTFGELRSALRDQCRVLHVSSALCQPLHAAFTAGLMPVLAGPQSFDVLVAYAEAVAGGRCLWLPVTPSFLSPTDLLSYNDGELLDLLLDAPASHEMHLVVLDGVNRAPVESYLMPIIDCYASKDESCARRMLPVHGLARTWADQRASRPRRVSWPPNVLIAGTLVSGVSTLSLSGEYWRRSAYIDSEGLPLPIASGGRSEDAAGVSIMSQDDWASLHHPNFEDPRKEPYVLPDWLASREPGQHPSLAHARVFYSTARDWSQQQAWGWTVKSILGPYLLATRGRLGVSEVIEMMGSGQGDPAEFDAEGYVERLGRHVLVC